MWRFKPFMPKEHAGLDGRSIDVGLLKLHVQNVIAEGGFSCVYLARDVLQPMKSYALKHMICNDSESLGLVMKEIAVLKLLRGHPNVITLCAETIVDMGRTKEAFLVMEFCDKCLVNVIDSRGAAYFDDKQISSIFRDICNAVFAMHCQSPPIAHRDLKAENLLMSSDGLWKLCDFGSTSTNHKRFEKPEEMGIEEDIIRKHTTPAYRPPEMWDLFRRELINEKVDIWALGCILFRICYFKSAFDGESKLQVLNGNYRIPEFPKYSSSVTNLIKDMLQSSPDARPDITQVWFRVNEQLPMSLQNSLPDRPPEMAHAASDILEGNLKPMPRRTPPPPPPSSKESSQNLAPAPVVPMRDNEPIIGAFWATQHAKDSPMNKKGSKSAEESKSIHDSNSPPSKDYTVHHTRLVQKNMHGESGNRNEDASKLNFFENAPPVLENEAFDNFVAEFDTSKLGSEHNSKQARESEVNYLKEQLHHTNIQKAEITSKYEKLSAICRSQRQEIQELKQALASAGITSPNREAWGNHSSSVIGGPASNVQRETPEKTILEHAASQSSPDSNQWQAFVVDPKPKSPDPKSVRTRNIGEKNKEATRLSPGSEPWCFETENFMALPSGTNLRRIGDTNNVEPSQPAGWAGF